MGTIVWIVTPCSSEMPDDSEDHINSTFGIEKLAIHEIAKKQSENGALSGIFQTTRRYNPKEDTPHSHLSEVLKSNLYKSYFPRNFTVHFVYISALSSFSDPAPGSSSCHKNISVTKETEHFS
jgi:hypothetical protein